MGTNDEFLSHAVSNKVPESTIQNGFFAKLPVHTTLVHPLSLVKAPFQRPDYQ